MNKQPTQLSLSIGLQDDTTFENYWVAQANQIALKAVEQFCAERGEQSVLLWGEPSCGLTHILQACSHHSANVAYLPLRDALDLSPELVCANLERAPLVCVDDLDALAGRPDWELAFFHLYNRLRDLGHRLLMSAHINPANLPIKLPDLHSRVMGSLVYRIDSLDKTQCAKALQMRAQALGMAMSDEVARYIIKRGPSSMKSLFMLLATLDTATIQMQKKLSVRVVKNILGL